MTLTWKRSHDEKNYPIMVAKIYGNVSLRTFVGGLAVLVLFLPSIFSSAYRQFVAAWWILILTIYVLLAILYTVAVFKDDEFKVKTLCYGR